MDQNKKITMIWMVPARLIVGIVFLFSGFVKAVDPLGSAIKFHDYFTAFNLDFLQPFTLVFAIMLSSFEFIVGASLFLNFRIREGIWGALLFMIGFTPLTLILALTNPVSDCGCFGDALILTNWATFFKNIVLLALVILLFVTRQKLLSSTLPVTEWMTAGAFLIFIVGISEYSIKHLPILDFRPYAIGASIPDGMVVPPDAPQDEYNTVLIYEKDGVQKEFTLENYPWKDSTWTFVDQHSTLVKEGYTPPIHDFEMIDQQGRNLTDEILMYEGYTFLLISTKLADASPPAMNTARDLSLFCTENSIAFYVCTASGTSEIEEVKNNWIISPVFINMDETTLKTIVRSNPGLLLIKEGVILGKWSAHDIPGPNESDRNLLAGQVTKLNKGFQGWKAWGVLAGFLLLWLLAVKVRK